VSIADSQGNASKSVRVANCSYQQISLTAQPDPEEELAYNRALAAGVVVIATARNGNGCFPLSIREPGSLASPLTVGSVNDTGQRELDASSTPAPQVDICAGGEFIVGLGLNNGCAAAQTGTSFAAPIVSGVAALLFDFAEADPTLARSPQVSFLVRKSLIMGAKDVFGGPYSPPVGRDPFTGWGLINGPSSLDCLQLSLACKADYDRSGVLDGDDAADFMADYMTGAPLPGPAGYTVPAVITMLYPEDPKPPAPFDELGYKCDFDQNGILNPDDLADYIAAFFAGC
jgi:hypothetical protein